MQVQQYQLRLQVFSNGHFRTTKDTPWEGIEKSIAFKHHLDKVMKGERVEHHGRHFRAV